MSCLCTVRCARTLQSRCRGACLANILYSCQGTRPARLPFSPSLYHHGVQCNFLYIVCADNRLKRIFFHNITPDSSKKKEMRCHCVSLGGSWCAGGGAESDLEAVLPALPTTFLHTDTPFLLLCPCLYRLKFFYIFLSMICSPLPPSSCLFLRNSNTFGRPPADDR